MFISTLVTVKTGNLWLLQEPLIWETDTERIEVEKDFATDLASIPKLFWKDIYLFGIRIWKGLKPWGPWARAATLHDWVYLHPEGKSRWQCDWLFFRAMRSDNVKWKIAVAFWLACVLVGWRWFGVHSDPIGV